MEVLIFLKESTHMEPFPQEVLIPQGRIDQTNGRYMRKTIWLIVLVFANPREEVGEVFIVELTKA